MLSKFFESLYNKVFVNIVIQGSITSIYMQECSKKDILRTAQQNFDTLTITEDILSFVSSYIKETPFYYIAILDMSTEQGAIPTCDKNRISFYHDMSSSEYKCKDERWTYYTGKVDLYGIEKHYKEVGLDFVFSPFILVSNFFKDKINSDVALYILVEENSLSLCIFEHSQLLFAKYLVINPTDEDDMSDDSSELISEGVNFDDMNALDDMDELDELDDFGDIEDLDSIEEIDEFSQIKEDGEEFDEEEILSESSEENFTGDYDRFIQIQETLGSFYNDKKYDGQFVQSVYIADSVGVSSELKKFLEEEMFLSVYIRHIDLGEELAKLSKMELANEA